MIKFNNYLSTIKRKLENDENFSDIRVVFGFSGKKKPLPMSKPTVAVGLENSVENRIAPVYSEDNPSTMLYNRDCNICVRFDVYVPDSMEGYKCYDIFSRIGEMFFENVSTYKFTSVKCGDLSYKRDEKAFLLTGFLEIEKRYIV